MPRFATNPFFNVSLFLFGAFLSGCESDSATGPVVTMDSSSSVASTPTESSDSQGPASSSSTPSPAVSSSSNATSPPTNSSAFDWGSFCWPGTDCTVSSSSSTPVTPSSSSSSEASLAGVIMGNQMWDQRDDALYDLVEINGKLWTENMNYETNDGSICYGDLEENCTEYGRLYTYPAALDVCPSGWHLPTLTEVNAAVADGLTLPYGGRDKSGSYDFLGDMGFMWTVNKGIKTQFDSRYKGFSVRCIQN